MSTPVIATPESGQTPAAEPAIAGRAARPSAPGHDEGPGLPTGAFVTGAPPGTRTPNPVIKSHLLCQLS